MSEKERKAMKYFFNLRANIDESYMLFGEELNVKCSKEMIKQISIVLNLIKRQQKEIEYWKEQAEGYSGMTKQIQEDLRDELEERDRYE